MEKLLRTRWLQITSLIFASIMFFFGMLNFFAMIEDEFRCTFKLLPMVITGILPFIFVFCNFHNNYVKRLTSLGVLILVSATILLNVVDFFLVIVFSHYYFGNPSNIFSTIVFFFTLFVTLATDVSLVKGLVDHRREDPKIEKMPVVDLNMMLNGVGRRIWYGFNCLVSSYFIVGAMSGLFLAPGNFRYDFLGYLYLLIIMIVPSIGLLSIFFGTRKKWRLILHYIALGLVSFSLISLTIVNFAAYRIFIEVGQNLFPIDFAASLQIGVFLLWIIYIGDLIPLIYRTVKLLKEKKSENR